ncbi:MAG TPA: monovalent cation:proton antiporter-2 (CPA2) family protein [Steroidobacteraceae bacterium]|nr:monovalent cation:proton antiporter-2 (CPA2) family protein [Steroidobacteraceae bacterium]
MISLSQVAVFLIAAVIFVPVFRWLRLSSILGYVAAGIAIGPWGMGLVADVHSIMHISEFGVVLLLFVIGLELQPSRLWVLRRAVFGFGSAQVVFTAILIGAAACLAGGNIISAGVMGFGLALSSTALVLQVLAERNQLKTNYGRAAFGILLFQDLAVLPMLAVLPLMSPDAPSLSSPLLGLAKLLVAIALVIGGGRLILRPALRLIARTRVTEVFTAAALLIVIGISLIVSAVGLSMSLGAFMAGVLLADSEFRHELEADIEPFKGLLLGLFFISVGMSANLSLLRDVPVTVFAVTLGFMLLKLLSLLLIGRWTCNSRDASWRLGLSMMAGGEFAFVLFSLAAQHHVIEPHTADILVLSVTLSMMMGPVLSSLYDVVMRRLESGSEAPFDDVESRDGRVLIAGFGRFGQIIGRILRARKIAFTALDASQANIDFLRRFGSQVYYGDVSRLDVLRAAGADRATVLVLAIDDVDASIRTAEIVMQHFPDLRIFARARNRQHAFRLMELGVQLIIRETYASSLEMAQAVMESLGEPASSARAAVRRFREHDEATLQRQFAVRDDDSKLIATSQESVKQLEQLFDADAAGSGGEKKPAGSVLGSVSQ